MLLQWEKNTNYWEIIVAFLNLVTAAEFGKGKQGIPGTFHMYP